MSILRYAKSAKQVSTFAALIVSFVTLLAAFLPMLSQPTSAATGINKTINFQGKMVNANGTNIANGTYNMRFRIYDASSGGTLVWTEDRIYGTGSPDNRVTVTDGIFQVNLGEVCTLAGSTCVSNVNSAVNFNTDNIYLTMALGNTATAANIAAASLDPEMAPRIRFTASPYAFNSDNLQGIAASGFVQLGQGSVQAVSTATSAIAVNQQSSGSLIQLQSSGTDAFTISSIGNLTFGQNANKTISVTTTASNAAGKSLTVSAGAGGAGASANAGGDLVLQGGAGGGTNGNGGNLTLDGGVKNGSGADGTISIGVTTGSSVTISKSGVTTTVGGGLTVNGGTATFGTASVAGALVVSDGSSSTITLKPGTQVASTNYDISVPAVTANDTLCLVSLANCSAGSSPFQTTSGVANLITSTDNLTIGSATNIAKVGIVGDTNEVQLGIKANATQTANLLQIQDSASSSLLNISATGNIETVGSYNSPFGGFGYPAFNTLVGSEAFNTWTVSNITTPTANSATSPAGDATAEDIVSTASGTHVISKSEITDLTTGTYNFSVWIKSATSQPFQLRIDGAGGTISPTTGTTASFTATPGWQRYNVTQVFTGASATSFTANIIITNNSQTISAWGAMLVLGTSTPAYAPNAINNTYPTGASVRGGLTVSDTAGNAGTIRFANSSALGNGMLEFAAPGVDGGNGSEIAVFGDCCSYSLKIGATSVASKFAYGLNVGGNLLLGAATGTPTADVSFDKGADRTINILQSTTGAGNKLTIQAGAGFATGNNNGGDLVLTGGAKANSGLDGSVAFAARASQVSEILKVQDSTSNTLLAVTAEGNIETNGSYSSPYGGIGIIGNKLLISEDFSNSYAWGAGTAAVTPDAASPSNPAPDGKNTADKFVAATAGQYVRGRNFAGAAAGTYTFSVWLKTNSGTQPVQLSIDSTAGTPTTGTLKSITATTVWQRYFVTQTFTGSPTDINPMITIVNGSSATIVGWGAQIQTGTAMGVYTPTNTTIIGSSTSQQEGGTVVNNTLRIIPSAGLGASAGILFGAGDNNASTYIGGQLMLVNNGGDYAFTNNGTFDFRANGASAGQGSLVVDTRPNVTGAAGNTLLINAYSAVTQAGANIAINVDTSTNFTVPNSASGNQTGLALTLKDGGASATATGISLAGTYDTGILFGGTATNLLSATNLTATSGGVISLGSSSTAGSLSLSDGSSNTVGITASGVGTNYTLTLPAAVGNASECLQNSGTPGVLTFSSCAASGGDNITVNATPATDANFIDVAASGTVAGTTWTLNTAPAPDTIALAVSVASASVAGVVTNGTQTLAGDKTLTGATALTGGNSVSKTLATNSGSTQNVEAVIFTTPADSSGTNISQGLSISPTITAASGGTNTANIFNIGAVSGNANVSLNAINIGALTGTGATETAVLVGANWDNVLKVGANAILNGSGVLLSAGLSGTYSNALTLSSASNVFSGATYNSLALTNAADGFTVAGGTTSRTLTVTAADVTVGSTIKPTSAGPLTVQANGANSLTLTANAASTWDIGANTLSLQTTGNGAITTGTGLLTVGGSQTFSGTAARTITGPATGGLTVNTSAGPLTISTTTSGTLAVTSAGALNLTGAAASTWDIGANTLSIQTSNNGAITTGTGLLTVGGNQTFNGTTARTITGPATGGLTVNTTSGPLTLSTTTSGTLAVTSAGVLTLTGAAASTWDIGANTLSLQTTNNGAITTGTGLLTVGGNQTFSGTTARTITGPSTGGLTINTTSGPVTLSTTTSGTLAVTSAGVLTLTGAAASTWDIGANTLSLQTTNNGAITTGTGLLTLGGNQTFSGTTARTITGPSTGGLTINTTSGPVTISTTTSGTLAVTSAGALNLTGAAASAWTTGANALTISSGGTSSWANTSGNLTISTVTSGNVAINSAGTSAIASSNYTLSSAGVVTLAGGQSIDLTSAVAANVGSALVVQPGATTTASSTGASMTLQAGNDSGATASTGGTLTLKGGNASGAGTQAGGGVTVDSGTGTTTAGAINIGTTSAGVISLGNVTNSTFLFNLKNSSATALQVKNGSGNELLTVDTTGSQLLLGKVGSGGINGKLTFNSATAGNFAVSLVASASTSATYSLTLPTALPGSTQCIQSTSAGVLSFATCGGGGAAKAILAPEFPGGVLTGDGTNNVGTMTSDFCSKTNTNPPDINTAVCVTAADFHNYYSWTASATNDYDIWVSWLVPSDFTSLATSPAVTYYGWRTSTSDSVTLTMYDDVGGICGAATAISGTVATWNNTNYATSSGCSNILAGHRATFRVQLSVGVTNEFARMGEITINYNK